MSASELLTRLKLISIEGQGVALEILYHWVTKFWVDFAVSPDLLEELRVWLAAVRPAEDVRWLHAEIRVTGTHRPSLCRLQAGNAFLDTLGRRECCWLRVSLILLDAFLAAWLNRSPWRVLQSTSRCKGMTRLCFGRLTSHDDPTVQPKALSIKFLPRFWLNS